MLSYIVILEIQVNESILGTCSDLMAAVRQLVVRASDLQREIVAAGKGGASPREFYKRNHRWTEGLLSGAKAVAIACQALMYVLPEVCHTCDLECNSVYIIIFGYIFIFDQEIRIGQFKKENIIHII